MKNRLLAVRWITVLLAVIFGASIAQAQTTYTWTNMVMAVQNWPDAGNWDAGAFVSGADNELRFFADIATALPNIGTQTITNVPAALSMNTLTLNGKGKDTTPGSFIIVGSNTSTWTIGNGVTSLVNLNTVYGGGTTDRDIAFTIAPNLNLNQAVTTFTGAGTVRSGFTFSGNIGESVGGYGITKSGTSRLVLSGANTYTGPTTLSAGTLRLGSANALPGGIGATGGASALIVTGGSLELGAGDFFRNLGTGSDQFQITGGASGFTAFGAPRVVTVNGDAATELVWGSADFVPTTLLLNGAASAANNALWLANNIDLNSASARTVQVNANVAILPGVIRNTAAGGLTISGAGKLVLTGNNTYTGNTTINNGATLIVSSSSNLGGAVSSLDWRGTLGINGTAITNMASLGRTVITTANDNRGFDIRDAQNTFTADQVIGGSGVQFKRGAGTLVLNQNNTFNNRIDVMDGGTLVLDYSTNNGSKIGNNGLNLQGANIVLRGGSHAQAVTSIALLANTGNSISREVGSTATIANAGALTAPAHSNLAISEPGIVSTTTLNVNGIQPVGRVTVGSDFATRDGAGLLQAYGSYTNYTAGAGGGDYNTVNQLTGGGDDVWRFAQLRTQDCECR